VRTLELLAGTIGLALWTASATAAGEVTFELTFPSTVRSEPFNGRVYLLTSRRQEPRRGPGWFSPEPFVACDVKDWMPDEPLRLTLDQENLLTFPRDFADVELRGARVQAVARWNPRQRRIGTGAGNGFSAPAIIPEEGTVSLVLDQVVPERHFDETRWSKLVSIRSRLLSQFHQHDVSLRCCVTLPASYDDHPERRYPVIYEIPGFGGTHFHGRRTRPVKEQNEQGVEFIRVMLDPSCPRGHHVFADSANNGPVGQALVQELIPEVDRRFRTIADSRARFLTGHSSGGWSSLWLQITYPEVFGGVWSTAPDPVDFRDFQRINLYASGANMYVDSEGERRPLAIAGGEVRLWYDDFAWMEHVLGPGGQLHSFEAVFSPRGDDGQPLPLWDRETGEIDSDVALSWEPYDIRLVLERNWDRLGPQLAGKIHIFMGSADTFLLDGATRLLKESLANLGSDADVEIHAGRDLGTLVTPQLRRRIRREMTEQFLSAYPQWPTASAAGG